MPPNQESEARVVDIADHTAHPLPAAWLGWATAEPRLVDPKVGERLRTLWRLTTTDDQRWELERLAEAIAAQAPNPDDYGLEAAMDDVHAAVHDLQGIARQLEKAAQR